MNVRTASVVIAYLNVAGNRRSSDSIVPGKKLVRTSERERARDKKVSCSAHAIVDAG